MRDPNDDLTLDLVAAAAPPRRGPGRPRIHATAAERQRAYRQRLRERGLRDMHRIVRDTRDGQPLRSDVISLDHIPEWRR